MLLSKSPAERGFACVSVSTTVSVPAPGVMVALALHASLQGGLPEDVKVNGVACAVPVETTPRPIAIAAPETSAVAQLFSIVPSLLIRRALYYARRMCKLSAKP
jgi:hypothetical protein